jgi:hypothetical protein
MTRTRSNDPLRTDAYNLARDGNSLAAISNILDVPRGTLGRWSREDSWRERMEEERQLERMRVSSQLQGFMATEVVASLHHIRHLRDNARNEGVQLQAAKFLATMSINLERVLDELSRARAMEIELANGERPGFVDTDSQVVLDELSEEDLEDRQRLRALRA